MTPFEILLVCVNIAVWILLVRGEIRRGGG